MDRRNGQRNRTGRRTGWNRQSTGNCSTESRIERLYHCILSYQKDILSTLLDVQPNNYVESQVLKSQLGDYYKDFNLLRNIKERAMIQARVPFELNVK